MRARGVRLVGSHLSSSDYGMARMQRNKAKTSCRWGFTVPLSSQSSCPCTLASDTIDVDQRLARILQLSNFCNLLPSVFKFNDRSISIKDYIDVDQEEKKRGFGFLSVCEVIWLALPFFLCLVSRILLLFLWC